MTNIHHSITVGYYTCKHVGIYAHYSSAANPATKPTKPVSGFATPAATPWELDEGAASLVGEDEVSVSVLLSVSVPVSEDSVAVAVGVALLLFSSSLELWVERRAGVARVLLTKSPRVFSVSIAHHCQCPAPNRTRLCLMPSPSRQYSIFHSARQQLIRSHRCYSIPRRRRQMSTRR